MESETKYRKLIDNYLNDIGKEGNSYKKYERILTLKNFLEWLKNGNYLSADSYKIYKKKIKDFSESFFSSNNYDRNILSSNFSKGHIFSLDKIFIYFSVFIISALIFIASFNISLLKKIEDVPLQEESISVNRVLPFKGTISETDGQPLQSKRDLTFTLYNEPKGGKPLYTGSCVGQNAVMPDYEGSFNIRIGADCQMKPIPQKLFNANQAIYLGVTVGSGEELEPRYQIFTSTYARDAAQLQGMSVGTKTSSIPFIDSTGKIVLESEAPTLISTDGTFTIEGKRILVKGTDSTGGDIIFQPAIGANVLVSSGKLGVGTLDPNDLLSIVGNSQTSPIASIKNITNIDADNTSVLNLHLGSSPQSELSSFINFYAASTEQSEGERVGGVRLNNEGVAYETSGADFAEYMKIVDISNIYNGSIISISYKGPHASQPNEKIGGAVTDTARFVGNKKMKGDSTFLIGFLGQIQVLVSTINGPIDTGNRIGATSIPGYGGNVIENEFSVGYALESSYEKDFSNTVCPPKFRTTNDPNEQIIKCGRLLIFIDQD